MTKIVGIEQVLEAWKLATSIHSSWDGGAEEEDIAEAERRLGRSLPDDLKALYRVVDGDWLIGGNLVIEPLLPAGDDDLSLVTSADLLRSWQWTIPQEMVLFATNGSEESYGLWYQEPNVAAPIVVACGEGGEGVTIIGDTLAGFLAGHTAYYLLMFSKDGYDLEPALNALGVPDEIRDAYGTDGADDYFRCLNWANPGLPDKAPNPYSGRGPTVADINAFAKNRTRG